MLQWLLLKGIIDVMWWCYSYLIKLKPALGSAVVLIFTCSSTLASVDFPFMSLSCIFLMILSLGRNVCWEWVCNVIARRGVLSCNSDHIIGLGSRLEFWFIFWHFSMTWCTVNIQQLRFPAFPWSFRYHLLRSMQPCYNHAVGMKYLLYDQFTKQGSILSMNYLFCDLLQLNCWRDKVYALSKVVVLNIVFILPDNTKDTIVLYYGFSCSWCLLCGSEFIRFAFSYLSVFKLYVLPLSLLQLIPSGLPL